MTTMMVMIRYDNTLRIFYICGFIVFYMLAWYSNLGNDGHMTNTKILETAHHPFIHILWLRFRIYMVFLWVFHCDEGCHNYIIDNTLAATNIAALNIYSGTDLRVCCNWTYSHSHPVLGSYILATFGLLLTSKKYEIWQKYERWRGKVSTVCDRFNFKTRKFLCHFSSNFLTKIEKVI